jgi:hypothetical protein
VAAAEIELSAQAAEQDFQSELDGPFGLNNFRLGLFMAALVSVRAN